MSVAGYVVSGRGAAIIHRDIKPENIFIAADGHLVLGDFGVVFYEAVAGERVTEITEKVGTTAYIPPWLLRGRRVDEVPKNYDVYALAKVLSFMVAGEGRALPFWHWDQIDEEDVLNLETLFADDKGDMRILNALFAKTITRQETDCLGDAAALLREVDLAIRLLTNRAQIFKGDDIPRPCPVCGHGYYVHNRMASVPAYPREDEARGADEPLSIKAARGLGYVLTARVFTCNMCGNVEKFHYHKGRTPTAWGA